ncbi:MAG: leucine-rich repeat protein, partial [Eubacterium sp.]|nr:leucine-rich repeat protein [Eubacterium sp.]
MKRKFIPTAVISLLVAFALAFSLIAYAENNVTWSYDSSTKTLYISGTGAMDNYENSYSAPWNSHILEIENLVVEDGVTSVGNYALSGAEKLDNVSLADSVKTIGEYAFASCPALKVLSLSSNVNSIADYSFAYNGVNQKDF